MTIGDKVDKVDKNVYTNDFFHSIYNKAVEFYDQEMFRSYFNLLIPVSNDPDKQVADSDDDDKYYDIIKNTDY